MKRAIWLAQVNNRFGNNCFLPYSVGLLQSYALSIPEIREAYDFKGFIFLREPIAEAVKNMGDIDVFAASLYIWNAEYTKALARAVKEANPNCLIILGGPHVPTRPEGYFQAHPWADILIHYEGEVTFAEVLKRRLETTDDDYLQIQGTSVHHKNQAIGCTTIAPPRERLSDLDSIPSPYLTGVFDDLLRLPFDFHATQETHRGCPYSCTFCDWGSNTLAKVKSFSTDRLVDEFEWMGRRQIDLLYNADANYAMLPRDLELTEKMVKTKEKYGYPNKFRAAYAKNSNEKVFQVAQLLNKAGMNKGITLSFQSMDDNTLQIVKRKNIKVKDFQNLIRRYRKEGIATYSELIIGLPGESYDTFADGINTLIDAGQHDSLQVYTCLSGDTNVITRSGPVPIQFLAENFTEIEVLTTGWDDKLSGPNKWVLARNIRKTGEGKTLLRLCFNTGNHLDCTPDHRLRRTAYNGNEEVQAANLNMGDRVSGLNGAPTIVSIRTLPGIHDVYCLEVPDVNWFYANGVLVHNCECLPNSEMSHPAYRDLHGIKTVHTPVLHFHATPSDDPHQEFYELVIATKTLPEDDWMRCQLFAWAAQAFHCLGLTQSIAVFLRHYLNLSYRQFYERLLEFADDHPWTVIGKAYRTARESFVNLKYGLEWGYRNEEFGDIIWPVEEGGFLSCVKEWVRFYEEIEEWVQTTFGVPDDLLTDLITYQEGTAKLPTKSTSPITLRRNIHEYLEGCYTGEMVELKREESTYEVTPTPYTDLKEFAKYQVWYNRKGGKFKNEVRHV